MENNILAVMATLIGHGTPTTVNVEMVNGYATNRLVVQFDFLKSAYRLTVERVPNA